ncbi:MAG TPA: thioredoxin domain-containing protein [Asticcacaulis sp.]|nr:thioredoxin domain-containing protein [Asticcacaulis sp.]
MLSNTFTRIAGLIMAAGLAFAVVGCSKEPSTDKITTTDMTMGSPAAKVTVVEYASVACPICAHVNETVFPQFKAKYIDTGKVYYIYRPMMTGNEPVSVAGHLLARCAGKEKAFKVVDAIMRSQTEMGGEESGYANALPVLQGIATQVGMSADDYKKCVGDPKGIEEMNDANTKAINDGVKGTPTFVINGKKMDRIPQNISEFDDIIQPKLK